MGVSLSTAKWLAPLSFAVDFAAQTYGMLSTPNMKNVHDANISFGSPQPLFIAGFFFPQQLLQLAWLWRLCNTDSEVEPKGADVVTMLDFAPFYALGNFCIAAWMVFWNRSDLKTSNLFVAINSLTQLYFIFRRLPPMNTKSFNSVLTHLVAKTFAGLAVLDLLHNTSAAYLVHQQPSTVAKVLTGAIFGLLASASDWIFGGCLVYDLVALSVGQSVYGNVHWGRQLAIYAGGTAAIVAVRNLFKPPYISQAAVGYYSM